MDFTYNDERTGMFVYNVGLITSRGKEGDSIMAAAWTYQVSYSPGLMAVCINPKHTTYKNILKSKEFGISIASSEQNSLSSLSGNYSGENYNKIAALKELGYSFFPAKKIKTILVKDAALNIECKLIKKIKLGDHVMLIGEILEVHPAKGETLVYYKDKYWNAQPHHKPDDSEKNEMKDIFEKHKKK